jgi:predicted lipoprotein with Yx(FWY)xxD motif
LEEDMVRLSVLAVLATAALAFGSDGAGDGASANVTGREDGGEAPAPPDEAAGRDDPGLKATVSRRTRRPGKKLRVVSSSYGRVVADGRGEALYLFDRDRNKRSRCYGECARAWPPVLTRGRPRSGKGVKARLLGTAKRKNGRLQVTYRNHPLYYYVADAPGRILCQNVDEFGGLWLVVEPSGNPVRGAG